MLNALFPNTYHLSHIVATSEILYLNQNDHFEKRQEPCFLPSVTFSDICPMIVSASAANDDDDMKRHKLFVCVVIAVNICM